MSAPILVSHRNNGADVAVVFIHGFSGNPVKTWGAFPALIAADARLANWDVFSVGYTTRLVPDIVGIWSADAPLDTLALLLSTTAGLPPLGRYKSLALVAHSMGGLVLQRALVDDSALSGRTSHIVMFGTPSGGLSKAGPFRFLKRQVRDMADSGEFITSLRSRWKAGYEPNAPFRFAAAAGDQDEFVPRISSLGPFSPGCCKVVPGNHLEIVKPADVHNMSVQLVMSVLIGEALDLGPGDAAAAAVESRDFVRALRLLEGHEAELDEEGLVQLALALEGMGRQEEAIQVLEKYAGTQTDAMGVLAGRLKRRWLLLHRRADAERALDLYQEAYRLSLAKGNPDQAFYQGINVAFMELAFGSDHEAARAAATDALTHCGSAKPTMWRFATEGEANLVLGRTATALQHYGEAVGLKPTPRQLSSIFRQALQLADLMGDDEAATELGKLYRGEEAASA